MLENAFMDIIKGVVAIIYRDLKDKEREYLLLQHKNTFWTFVGGRVEEIDPSIEAGLNREINEELGLTPLDFQLKNTDVINEFIYGNEKPDRAGKKGITYYYSGVLLNNANPICHAEIINLGWFTKAEVLNYLAFNDIKDKFLESIAKN